VSRRSAGGRVGTARRATSESRVDVELDLDGTGASQISTGVPFYDHMLTALSTHSLIDLKVSAEGDLAVDAHHTVEDVAIVIGQALAQALGDKAGIVRYGDALVPLDEALAQAVVDVSGRPYFVHSGEPDGMAYVLIGGGGSQPPYTGSLTAHVFESLAHHAGITLHVRLLSGRDPHHIVEAQFKALARALRQAVEADPRRSGVPSTKGSL
jgi:imidazoleglycerol-phosphate dehydratase